MLKAIAGIKEVGKGDGDVRIVDVITWRSDVGAPEANTLTKSLLDAVNTAQSNLTMTDPAARDAALTLALENVLSLSMPPVPTGQRIPDRSLVEGMSDDDPSVATGQRANDAQIEAGLFQIKAVVNGDNWWVVLDVEPADIRLE